MLSRATRYLLAAIQAIVGWEWIVSGSNKVLSGTFPQSLLDTLNKGIQNNPNAWYVSFPGVVAALTNESIDIDALVPPFSLVILIANLALIKALRGETWYSRGYKLSLIHISEPTRLGMI